jgi:hypothetical protein
MSDLATLQREAEAWKRKAQDAEAYRTAAGFTYAHECWQHYEEIMEAIDELAAEQEHA